MLIINDDIGHKSRYWSDHDISCKKPGLSCHRFCAGLSNLPGGARSAQVNPCIYRSVSTLPCVRDSQSRTTLCGKLCRSRSAALHRTCVVPHNHWYGPSQSANPCGNHCRSGSPLLPRGVTSRYLPYGRRRRRRGALQGRSTEPFRILRFSS
jgi:hypothetical protein